MKQIKLERKHFVTDCSSKNNLIKNLDDPGLTLEWLFLNQLKSLAPETCNFIIKTELLKNFLRMEFYRGSWPLACLPIQFWDFSFLFAFLFYFIFFCLRYFKSWVVRQLERHSQSKFITVNINFRFTCDKSNLKGNILSLIVAVRTIS